MQMQVTWPERARRLKYGTEVLRPASGTTSRHYWHHELLQTFPLAGASQRQCNILLVDAVRRQRHRAARYCGQAANEKTHVQREKR